MDKGDAAGRRALERLAHCDAVELFEHVVLVSSEDDSFVAMSSALAYAEGPGLDPRSSRLGREMQAHLPESKLLRLHGAERMDWLVGRSAHIEFLLSNRFVSTLVAAYPTIFE